MEKKKRTAYNRRNPPRIVVRFEVKGTLARLLIRGAKDEGVSVSKLVNDLLSEGFDIPKEER